MYTFEFGPLSVNAYADVFGIILALLFIDRAGRVSVQLWTYSVGALFLVVFGFVIFYIAPISVQTFVIFAGRVCSMAGGVVTWTTTVEILPTALRATGH